MDVEKIINFIEDKDIEINNDWYFHATAENIDVVKNILDEGIKCAHLRNKKPNHFNGKYYVSLYKHNTADNGLNLWLDKYPKFVIKDINPIYADRKKLTFRRMFINTRIPLRTSEWDGEYQEYLMIDNSKFVALGYDISYIFSNIYCKEEEILEKLQKEKLLLLKMVK